MIIDLISNLKPKNLTKLMPRFVLRKSYIEVSILV